MAPGIKDAAMQEALIRAVNDEFKDSPNNVTVKRIRTLAETSLGLDEGFFKSHDKWNGRSKALINDEFVSFLENYIELCLHTLSRTDSMKAGSLLSQPESASRLRRRHQHRSAQRKHQVIPPS